MSDQSRIAPGEGGGAEPQQPGLAQRAAAPVVEAAGRRAVATVVTPGVERVIALIGYRRVLIAGGLAIVTIVAILVITILAAASAVTALPMRLADALIGGDDGRPAAASVSASESLSPKELQYLVSQCSSNTAEASTSAASTTPPVARATTARAGQSAAASSSATATPVALGHNGQVPSKIAKDMSEQVPDKTDAVKAQTWFLYRLVGAGDTWSGFEQHIQTAGVRVTPQASAEQLLRQIMPSDINVTVTRQQRTAAAALTLDGIRQKRIAEPSKPELQNLATQIVEACTGYNAASAAPSTR